MTAKTSFLSILSVLIFHVVAFCQPTIQWKKTMGGAANDRAYSIQQTSDSGYIIAGHTNSINLDVTGNHGNYDCWIVKTDGAGNIEWQKALGGANDDYGYIVQQTTDGGYIVAATTNSNSGDVTGNHGGWDYWVVKLDGAGNIVWQKTLGGSFYEFVQSISQTLDGGYIVAGFTNSPDGDITGHHGEDDFWIVKLDSTGALQWQKALGGSNYDEAICLQLTADGGFIVGGLTSSTNGDVVGYHGGVDAWIVKLDSGGNIQWQKPFGGTDGESTDSVEQTPDGGYIFAGKSKSNNGDVTINHGGWDCWIVKLDSTGAIQWQKSFGGSLNDYAKSINHTADGGYIVAGYTNSNDGDVTGNHGNDDYWILKLDSTGNLQWQKTFGGLDIENAYSIQQSSDGGYIVAGTTNSNNGDATGNHGNYDFWIVKLSPSLGIESNIKRNFAFYPNPIKDILYFNTPETVNKVEVYSVAGKKLNSLSVSENKVDLNEFKKGTYILKVFTENEVKSAKVIKE